MSNTTTVGKILLKQHLPEEFHQLIDKSLLDKKGITELFSQVAAKYPERYNEIVTTLTRLGFEIATRYGSSVSLHDMISDIDKTKIYAAVDKEVHSIKKSTLPAYEKRDQIFEVYQKAMSQADKDLLQAGLKTDKTLAKMVLSGSRASPTQYRSTVLTNGLMSGPDKQPMLDFPVRSSFAEGLTPTEYLVATYGARAGQASAKLATADSGFLCLTGETLVRMADYSVKEIQQIEVGEWVLGSDLSGRSLPVQVSATFKNGVKPCNEYVFRVGKSRKETITVRATAQHEVLTPTGKKAFGCGKKLSALPVGRPLNFAGSGLSQYPETMLLGYLVGNGGLTGNSLYLSTDDIALIQAFNTSLAAKNLQLVKVRERAQDYEYMVKEIIPSAFNRDSAGRVIAGTNNPFKARLASAGLLGKYSFEKSLTGCMTLPLEELAALLGGLFEADGCVSITNNSAVPVIAFFVTSAELVQQVRDILFHRFGIYTPSIRSRALQDIKASHTTIRGEELIITARHAVHGFIINDLVSVRRFAEFIPMPGVKGVKLRQSLADLTVGRYDGFNFNLLSITPIGEQCVCDLEVNHPDHLYVLANGLIVSNSKQLTRSMLPIKIEMHDCGTDRGVTYPVDDTDSIGCFLATPVGSLNKNTEITPVILAGLRNKGIKQITVRSPITCQASKTHHFGALCQLCVGVREKGLPGIGEHTGVISAAAFAEPLSQGMLSFKHSSGTATKSNSATGFSLVNQLLNIPKTFKGKALLAPTDGKVTDIYDSAGGGSFIEVQGLPQYLATGLKPTVKVGQAVEAGDLLSEGVIDPREVVKHKGIGEGRRYFVSSIKKAMDDGNMKINRRNFELLSRGIVDHVRVDDPTGLGGYLPDQVVSYQTIERHYKPRKDSKRLRVDLAKGEYLEEPVLHLTIGTRLSSSMLKELQEHGISSVLVNHQPPMFTPVLQRLLDVPGHVPDWAHQLYSTYLERRLLNTVNTGVGSSSSITGPSPVLGLAYAKDFGLQLSLATRRLTD